MQKVPNELKSLDWCIGSCYVLRIGMVVRIRTEFGIDPPFPLRQLTQRVLVQSVACCVLSAG